MMQTRSTVLRLCFARRCAVEMLVAKGGVRTRQARGRDEFPSTLVNG